MSYNEYWMLANYLIFQGLQMADCLCQWLAIIGQDKDLFKIPLVNYFVEIPLFNYFVYLAFSLEMAFALGWM